ncbi:golgin subfamily A member 6-like protein 22 isoform X2 [Actinia tenebrosa]|uniref:Golgin subfamily A member 6-like protein 22 isoform X2 n=1 Tax=Actinia tenebrosa TaxID=6105 RepID=A0A6P8J048_ACTTE|nr:golgin subfamily A member 6-like protein 22 isoform X2 [Actinia tenebrosa]
MADKGKTSYVGRLKDDIKKNERIQIEMEEKLRKLEEKLKDHDENCQTKINELEEEIKRLKGEIEKLKEENNTLQENIKELEMKTEDLEESNTFLEKQMKEIDDNAKKEIGELKTKLGNLDEKLKKSELSEDELIIRQLCSSVQENLSRIVLQGYFEEIQNKRTQDMENYISTQIEDEDEQNKARLRWEELKKEINWNEFWIKQLKPVKKRGNETAHPPLTEKVIDAAKNKLKRREKLGKHNVKAVDQLKDIWTQTNRKLPQGSSTKGQEQSGSRFVSTARRTYANKAAGGRRHDFSIRKPGERRSISRYACHEKEH